MWTNDGWFCGVLCRVKITALQSSANLNKIGVSKHREIKIDKRCESLTPHPKKAAAPRPLLCNSCKLWRVFSFHTHHEFFYVSLGICFSIAVSAHAQVPGPEIKKTQDGYCLLRNTPAYALATQFTPLPSLGDCLQSGGVLPQPPEGIQPYALPVYCRGVDCVDSLSKFQTVYPIQPSGRPRLLPLTTRFSFKQRGLIQNANRIFDTNPTLAILLVEKGEIIFERYRPEVGPKTPFLGYSMGKSLTALTVGRVHCSGLLPDLDRKAKSYDDRLAGTQYGEATVRQLLMMASGATRGSAKGGGSPLNPPAHLPNAFLGSPWYAGYADYQKQLHDYGAPQKKPDQSFEVDPGFKTKI